jgi:hypothetical protein
VSDLYTGSEQGWFARFELTTTFQRAWPVRR